HDRAGFLQRRLDRNHQLLPTLHPGASAGLVIPNKFTCPQIRKAQKDISRPWNRLYQSPGPNLSFSGDALSNVVSERSVSSRKSFIMIALISNSPANCFVSSKWNPRMN